MIVTAIRLDLIAGVRRVSRTREHFPKVLQAALDALPLCRIGEPPRFEENLSGAGGGPSTGRLTGQFQLQLSQLLGVLQSLFEILGIERQEIPGRVITKDASRFSA